MFCQDELSETILYHDGYQDLIFQINVEPNCWETHKLTNNHRKPTRQQNDYQTSPKREKKDKKTTPKTRIQKKMTWNQYNNKLMTYKTMKVLEWMEKVAVPYHNTSYRFPDRRDFPSMIYFMHVFLLTLL